MADSAMTAVMTTSPARVPTSIDASLSAAAVASVVAQLTTADAPAVTLAGVTVTVTVGGGGASTDPLKPILPLARVKKVMRLDETLSHTVGSQHTFMLAAEAVPLMAKAADIGLTLKSIPTRSGLLPSSTQGLAFASRS